MKEYFYVLKFYIGGCDIGVEVWLVGCWKSLWFDIVGLGFCDFCYKYRFCFLVFVLFLVWFVLFLGVFVVCGYIVGLVGVMFVLFQVGWWIILLCVLDFMWLWYIVFGCGCVWFCGNGFCGSSWWFLISWRFFWCVCGFFGLWCGWVLVVCVMFFVCFCV